MTSKILKYEEKVSDFMRMNSDYFFLGLFGFCCV